ncbi:MAG: glycosyltransferase family 39 protein [Planctomyces sp.]|nr:glycosyltransferase family 39 protein [Planctomyces sp.]
MPPASDRLSTALLIVAVLSAVGLSLPALQGQPLALDEHVSYFAAAAPDGIELARRSLEVMATPPLSHVLERFSLSLFGHSETALRLPSLAAYVAGVGLTFLFARRLCGPLAGGLAAVLMAWHPDVLHEVRIARCYGLVVALSAASLWLWARWRARPAWADALGWAAASVALLWTHYLAAPLVLTQGLLALATAFGSPRTERRERLTQCVSVALLVCVLCVPLIASVLRLSEWSEALGFQAQSAEWRDFFPWPWQVLILTALPLTAALQLVGVIGGPRVPNAGATRAAACLAFVLWLAPLGILALGTQENPTLASPRYRTPMAPASAAAVAGLAAVALRPGAACFVMAVSLAAGWSAASTPAHRAGRLGDRGDEKWRAAALIIADDLQRPDVLTFTLTGLAESLLVPAIRGDERFDRYVSSRLGAFYTNVERGIPLPMIWSGGGFLEQKFRERLADPGIREVLIVAAVDTDLNVRSMSEFERLLASAGYVADGPLQVGPEALVVRYRRRE